MANSGMAALPDDIILDILCRLGVEDLLRFRCVSKQFCSLIDDPYFIKLHLSHSLKTNTNLSVILQENDKIFSVDFDSLETATKLDYPLEEFLSNNRILGSCNGLLALKLNTFGTCLWNPSTRKYFMLPHTEIGYPPLFNNKRVRTFATYGFGYEPISDDYKLVRMVQFKEMGGDYVSETEVEVYSLRTNSWRRIKDFPFRLIYFHPNGILANHALHWMVCEKFSSDTKTFVVAFDLGTEEYRVVPLPDGLGEVVDMRIIASGGSLCLIASNRLVDVFDIWVMEEYGVKESWNKLIPLKHPDDLWQEEHDWELYEVFPLEYWKSGHKLLLERGRMDCLSFYLRFLWYDLTSKQAKRVVIQGAPETYPDGAYMLVQSLVPPDGYGVNSKAWVSIWKLTDEKSAVLQQNQILNQQLEITKSQAGGGFSFVLLIGLLGVLIGGYLVKRA